MRGISFLDHEAACSPLILLECRVDSLWYSLHCTSKLLKKIANSEYIYIYIYIYIYTIHDHMFEWVTEVIYRGQLINISCSPTLPSWFIFVQFNVKPLRHMLQTCGPDSGTLSCRQVFCIQSLKYALHLGFEILIHFLIYWAYKYQQARVCY